MRIYGVLIVFAAAALLISCQTKEKDASSATQASPQLSADNWQKSKECTAQAELMRGKNSGVQVDYEKSSRDLAKGLPLAAKVAALGDAMRSGKAVPAPPIEIEKSSLNHYSAKYGKCFVTFTYVMNNAKTDSKIERTYSTILLDAFEGSLYATLDFGKPCYIGGEPADCDRAKDIISDAMNNWESQSFACRPLISSSYGR